MKVALPSWLNYYKPEDLLADTRLKLLVISSSSIDRLLKPYKEGKRGLPGTKSGVNIDLIANAIHHIHCLIYSTTSQFGFLVKY